MPPARSQAEAARSQAELARRAHVAGLFHRSASELGDQRRSVRLAAIYTLGYIAKNYRDLSWPVIEVLALHFRESREAYGNQEPPIELQEIVNILKSDLKAKEAKNVGESKGA
ncbi:MAG: hypothetical protein H0T75_16190 [Rhizobiales bacterium]|nr:hypothetical protein [Hyphomicrobiales bacterium]